MEEFEWNVVNEGQLLDAMVGHKPIGVNKYFQMALICDKFCDSMHKDVDPNKVWAHLETMYNLEALDESESIPFPNGEKEFFLPESEFGTLLQKKEEEADSQKKDIIKKDDKTPVNKVLSKEIQRRDSKDSREANKTPVSTKKEVKKEPEKQAKIPPKNRNSLTAVKDDKTKKTEETPKIVKRPTRGSLKPNDDSGSSGKSSPITVTPNNIKRRRI